RAVEGDDPRPRVGLRLRRQRQHRRVLRLVPAAQARDSVPRPAAAAAHEARRRLHAGPVSDAPRTQDAPDARDARLPRWQRVPLRTTAALAVSAIAAVVLLIIGVASVLGLRASVLAQLDAELARELSTPIAAWDDATGGGDDAAPPA